MEREQGRRRRRIDDVGTGGDAMLRLRKYNSGEGRIARMKAQNSHLTKPLHSSPVSLAVTKKTVTMTKTKMVSHSPLSPKRRQPAPSKAASKAPTPLKPIPKPPQA